MHWWMVVVVSMEWKEMADNLQQSQSTIWTVDDVAVCVLCSWVGHEVWRHWEEETIINLRTADKFIAIR